MIARRAPWLGRFARQLCLDVLLHVGIALLAGLSLFIAVDVVESGNLASATASAQDLLLLELHAAPRIVLELAGMAGLIGTLTALSALARRGELVAFFAAGAPPGALLRPALLVGLMVALASAALTEWVAPSAAAQVSALRRRIGLPSGREALHRGQRWFRGSDRIFRVDDLEDREGRVLAKVLILRLADGRLLERWDAARLVFDGQAWVAEDVVHRRFEAADGLTTERAARLPLELAERPADFVRSVAPPDRLPLAALLDTLRARERLGQPALEHRLELARRLARPLALLLAIPLGVALALRLGRRPTFAGALAAGGGAGFALWMTDEVGMALAGTGALSPGPAAHLGLVAIAGTLALAWRSAERRGLAS